MIEISVLIMAISVAVLVAFLAFTLRKVQVSLETANQTLTEAKDAIHSWKDDVDSLIVSVKDLTTQVNRQVEAVDPLMLSVKDMGEAIHNVTASAREASASWMGKIKKHAQREETAEAASKSSWLDWVETGFKAYHVVRSAVKVLQIAPDTAKVLQKEMQSGIPDVQQGIAPGSKYTGHRTAVELGL